MPGSHDGFQNRMNEHNQSGAPEDPSTLARLLRQQETVQNLIALYDTTHDSDLLADIGRAHGRLGELQRVTGAFESACKSFQAATQIWIDLERPKAEFLATCKFALCAGYAGIAAESWKSLLDRIDKPPALEVYRDFVHDYRAQCAMQSGDPAQALADLQTALDIRLKAGRGQRQIDETHARIDEAAAAAALLAETD